MTRFPVLSLLTATLTTVVLAACSPKSPDPGEFVDIDTEGWVYGKALIFTPGADTAYERTVLHPDSIILESQVELNLRHSNAYAYANIWLEMTYPSGDTMFADTINMTLADSYGKWLGKGIGPSYQISDTISTRRRINDNPKISIRHIMRVDTLREVEQLGLRIISR